MLALAVAAVVAGGAGTAIAAGSGALGSTKPTDNPWVQALAKKLGTTPDKLVEAMTGVASDRIDALVADGTITQAQADTLTAKIAANGGLGFRGFGPGGMGRHGFGGPGMHGALGDPLQAAADYLGMTRDDLDSALDGGKKLSAIVTEQGETTDGLKAALIADAKKKIDALISSSLGHDRSAGGGIGPGGMGLGGPGLGGFGRGLRGMHGDLPGLGGNGPSVDQLPAPGARYSGRAAGSTGV